MSAELIQLTATTLAGLEGLLAKELRSFGAHDVVEGNRAVYFKGDLGSVYKVNFRSRFALRILRPVKEFVAHSEDAYYARLKGVPWEKHLRPNQTFSIRTTVHSETFTHSRFMALKAKDAIVDRLREKIGDRPNIDTESPDIPIHIRISKEKVTVSLDSTGTSLHQRGYRRLTGQAPLNEVLAAGIVELSEWDPTTAFYDGMCGSGTLAIEAAIKGLNIPPGLFRKVGYAFQNWPDFDQNMLSKIVDAALGKVSEASLSIYASDSSVNVVSKAKKNVYGSELEDEISVESRDFFDTRPSEKHGTLVLNPPYGERMHKEDIDTLYQRLGDAFKQHWQGFSCFIFSANTGALKKVGLRTSMKTKLYNGQLEARLARYDMYQGSKKIRA